jgi:amino acid transporter
MNEQIINPMLFYLIDVASSVEVVAIILVILCGIAISIKVIVMGIEELEPEDVSPTVRKIIKGTFITAIVSVLLITVIPNEKTMYTMVASTFLTKENIDKTQEEIKETIDYIFDKVEEVNESNE